MGGRAGWIPDSVADMLKSGNAAQREQAAGLLRPATEQLPAGDGQLAAHREFCQIGA